MGEPKLSTEEIDTVRYWAGLDGDHAMKRRVLRLLAEHAALGVWLATRTGERDAALRDLAEARAKLQESQDECDDHIHAEADRRQERDAALRDLAELREAARELRLALLSARLHEYQQVLGKSTVKVLLTPSDWEAVKHADDAMAALLPAEPPKEASDGK